MGYYNPDFSRRIWKGGACSDVPAFLLVVPLAGAHAESVDHAVYEKTMMLGTQDGFNAGGDQ